jgi:hypothetical protein
LVLRTAEKWLFYVSNHPWSMKYPFFAFSFVCLLAACQPTISPQGMAADYFPPTALLRKGVVSKYYFHYTSADGYTKSTDIRYQLYRLSADDRLEITTYDAGFEPLERSLIYFKDNQQIVEQQEQFWQGDTFSVAILQSVLLNWQGDTARLESQTTFNEGTELKFLLRQTHFVDSLIGNQPAKVFYQEREQHYHYPQRDDRSYQAQIRDTYLKGMGLYARELYSEEGVVKMELVEQMPRKTFLKRRAAAPKRVGYINPANTLDNGAAFKVCDPQERIHDYYNGNPDAGYRPGKRGLEAVFREQLDTTLLTGVSGYLTYRFVINCEGKAGRFITEEADLDFKRMEFPQPLVQHCFDILYQLTDWEAAVLGTEPIDTYVYITLKFRNGTLVDILP